MDFSRIFGAVLQGAALPPRRRSRRRAAAIPGLGGSRSGTAQLTRALAGLVQVATEVLANRAPAPPPEGRSPPAQRGPDARSAPPGPARRSSVPSTATTPKPGASPWAAQPATPPAPEGPGAEYAEALLMLRAMIAAARADGAIDVAERKAIATQLDGAGLSSAERDLVLADFDAPLTPAMLARQVTDPMQAAQLYAAAFAGAGTVDAAERAWLDTLAGALRLDAGAAKAIEARLGG